MIYQIAICDDCTEDVQHISRLAKEWADAAGAAIQLDTYPSAEAFLMSDQKCDILLLDIEMSGMDGVTLAREIRKTDDSVQIVFISGYSDYIADGYDVSALHYLIKPVKEQKLFEVLSRAVERLSSNARALYLEAGGESVRIPLRDIRYLEVMRNYTTIHTGHGDHTIRRTLNELERLLDESFFRLGRSYIVRLSCIRRVTRTQLELISGELLALPRGCYESINRAIIQQQ